VNLVLLGRLRRTSSVICIAKVVQYFPHINPGSYVFTDIMSEVARSPSPVGIQSGVSPCLETGKHSRVSVIIAAAQQLQ